MEEFLDAYIAGWQIPVNHDGLRRNVRPWLVQSGWSLFLARVEGKPAATAILYVESGAGYLADASCDPIYRRRGLHAALLERRIGESSAAGVGLICSGAAFLSASHRNMERAGCGYSSTVRSGPSAPDQSGLTAPANSCSAQGRES